jgi:uncharacterized membrane protein HdeD (DUF308 family)
MLTLIRNWWMVAIRGGLAAVFGLTVLLWPEVSLWRIVVLFGLYAILDGAWAIASVAATSGRLHEAWPVAAEGIAGVVLGSVALAWPWLPTRVIYVVAGWGILTGVLDILVAVRLPRTRAGHWLLGTAGAFSIFLAGVILMLPHTDAARIARALGTYALAFGVLVTLTAAVFREAHATMLRDLGLGGHSGEEPRIRLKEREVP